MSILNKPPLLKDVEFTFQNWLRNLWMEAVSPNFRVHRNGVDQTGIVSATETVIQFTTQAIDTHNWWSTSTYRYTPKIAGTYRFCVIARWNYAFAAANTHFVKIYRNNAEVALGLDYYTVGAMGPTLQADTIQVMNGIDDYIEFKAYQNSGSNRDLLGNASATYAFGYKISG